MGSLITKEILEKELENIVRQVIAKYQPEKVILFGSLVNGKIDQSSDLDLLIIKDDVDKNMFIRLVDLEKLIDYKIATDFLVYTSKELEENLSKGDPFIRSILKEGKVLYERK